MKDRIITGLIGGTVFLSILYVGNIYFYIFVLLLSLVGFHELLKMRGNQLLQISSLFGVSVIIAIFGQILWEYSFFSEAGIMTVLLFGLAIPVITKNQENYEQIAFSFLSSMYIGLGFYSIYLVRSETDFIFTIMILLAIWATDTGAYFTGYMLKGRGPKLWESISPKKTVAGAIGGTICSLLVVLLLSPHSSIELSLYTQIIIGVLIAVVGQLGDLVESSYKRFYNVKDSGNILPGHGGILDRFDSLLYVFPVIYVLLIYITF
ncbi:hypothetical protein BHU72_03465 [Desulfuribacillus stibiiarsenatis]|uniref:Phosphatidate cytidylyltransferase n=1 Tax=Desulfuribacillus stibiiarsenatis TaxID=1390249 RepID=A0A1E5L783_9FIRM|nr:phosphatidate cytidylyltransferase [Desulfuribacillus stibiiarsenatis]OEH85849.1 hypothetical protein BHU72_03465 [Desulfuribacillus stibiiarsenatis]